MIIKMTGASKNVKSTLKYVEPNSNKAHKNNNGVTKRNLIKVGLGCRTDSWQHTLADFKAYSKPHRKIQSYDFVLSPRKDDFNPDKKEDVYRFTKYATDFAEKAFPHHQVLIAPQDDNTNKNLHAHLIVSNFDVRNGKSLNGSLRNFRRLRYINDKMVKSYNKKYPHNKIYDIRSHQDEPTPRQDKIITLFHNGLTNPKVRNMSQLRTYIKDNSNGITMHTINMGKSTKKYKNHRGIVFKIQNGKRYKDPKHNKFNNKNTYIRFGSLAKMYRRKYHLKYYISYKSVKNYLKKKRAKPLVHVAHATGIKYIITKHYPKNSYGYYHQQNAIYGLERTSFAETEKSFIKGNKDIGIKLVTKHIPTKKPSHKTNSNHNISKVSKVISNVSTTPAPSKATHVAKQLDNYEQKLIQHIVSNSVSSNKFKFPKNDEIVPHLVKTNSTKNKDDSAYINDDINKLRNSAYHKYVNHQGHWLSQQKQLTGYHWATKFAFNKTRTWRIRVPNWKYHNKYKFPTFRKFKCLGGFTMPQIIYSSNNGTKEQDDIAQNAFKREDEQSQDTIGSGATEVEQADAEDIYKLNRDEAKAIREAHQQSDDGPTMSPF